MCHSLLFEAAGGLGLGEEFQRWSVLAIGRLRWCPRSLAKCSTRAPCNQDGGDTPHHPHSPETNQSGCALTAHQGCNPAPGNNNDTGQCPKYVRIFYVWVWNMCLPVPSKVTHRRRGISNAARWETRSRLLKWWEQPLDTPRILL